MQYDAIVIGGSFAGLAAATYLARARRSVCILDTRSPRNRYAKASHGFLGQDGTNPLAILDTARTQVLAYSTVVLIEREAIKARPVNSGFAVSLADGTIIEGQKLILAFGLRDILPAIPGIKERWGSTVLHCPYCHGIEFANQPLGVLHSGTVSVHQALLIADWGPTTLYLNGAKLDEKTEAKLVQRGVKMKDACVKAVAGENGGLSTIILRNGTRDAISALYLTPQSVLSSSFADQLGITIDHGPIGPTIRTDADRMTTVPGIYAAGDIARVPHSVSWAVADGVTAGTAAHRALVFR
ncbi:NAD(P)/FAD-dependent oxidoreductase [Acetobacter fabarum]|uniref:NAD(P)/FAD-dependent oxidoreductase n=1 Tax=Acetobacter fabarum TaxID=483199 RepID=UPI00312B62FA